MFSISALATDDRKYAAVNLFNIGCEVRSFHPRIDTGHTDDTWNVSFSYFFANIKRWKYVALVIERNFLKYNQCHIETECYHYYIYNFYHILSDNTNKNAHT